MPQMALPPSDQFGAPAEKMPDCPSCGEDELGMITPGRAFCYVCAVWYVDRDARTIVREL